MTQVIEWIAALGTARTPFLKTVDNSGHFRAVKICLHCIVCAT